MNLPKIIVIVGPTCSGKTDLAVKLAQEINSEIISADSLQVYREFSICTSKPTLEQLDMVKHHLIGHVPISNRTIAVEKKLMEFSRAELVITDRLHAMLFAAITGTPCVAFDNSSKKVSGVYEWIRHLDYIALASSEEKAKNLALKMIDKKGNNFIPPSFVAMEEKIRAFINN